MLNLCKPDSLYNEGMKILVYSERMASHKDVGWHRAGTKIGYYNNGLRRSDKATRSYYTHTFTYNFEYADVDMLFRQFEEHEKECQRLLEVPLALPAYERMLKTSHTFNLLDARRAISVTERQRYILRVRTLARGVAEAYYQSREKLGFPMLRGVAP
jgi:glycyl-tRNA synthetase alpha subunit